MSYTLHRYFEVVGWTNKNTVEKQYVDFSKIFKNSYPTFNPSKRSLHKYCDLKSISHFKVVDGFPIYENDKIVKVEF